MSFLYKEIFLTVDQIAELREWNDMVHKHYMKALNTNDMDKRCVVIGHIHPEGWIEAFLLAPEEALKLTTYMKENKIVPVGKDNPRVG